MADGLHNLKPLTLKSNLPNLEDGVQIITRLCRALRRFELDGEQGMPSALYSAVGAALVGLASANPSVTEFTLRGLHCEDKHLTTVAQCWSKLYLLVVTCGLSHAALTAFAQHCPRLSMLCILGAD